MSAFRLVFLPREGQPARVWRFEAGRVVDRREGLGDVFADLPTIVVVPGESVLCRRLELPAGRDVQAAAAAGFMLEDELAQPSEEMHVALGRQGPDGRRLAVLVDRAQMHAWIEAAAALPRVDAILPDCLLVSPPEGEAVRAVRLGQAWLVRGPDVAATIEPDLLPLVAAEASSKVEEPREVEALVAEGLDGPVFDLRQGAFAPRGERQASRLRTPLLLALLVALSVPALPAAQAARYAWSERAAVAELKTLSGVSDGAEAVSRLQARLGRLQAAERFPGQAAAVLAAVERVDGMELQSLLYDEGGVFYLSASHANYSDVDLLRSTLARSGLAIEEKSAGSVEGRIVSDFVVRPQT
jgi:general secretion pathway protein L